VVYLCREARRGRQEYLARERCLENGGIQLAQALGRDPALYKLRRFGNERMVAENKV
jgi:hypothetical protein